VSDIFVGIGVFVVICAVFAAGFVSGANKREESWRAETVKRGYAVWTVNDQATGKATFCWKEQPK
jgi:hypothetical protein